MDEQISVRVGLFFEKYPKRSYPKDQIIIFSGDKPGNVFYMISGKVRQYDISYRGDEIITNLFKPPAFFPMSHAINDIPNHFFYKAEEDTVVRLAPPEDVVQFLLENPDIMLNLLSRVYLGVEGVLGRVVHLMSGTARSRLIYELIIECRRFGIDKKDGTYHLDTHETHLASRSGLSRETVSREMKHLKASGIIRVTTSGIEVEDLVKLEKLLGSEV